VHQRCGAITDGTTDQMKDYHPMSNLTLFIIRHAEKPDEAWPGPGLTEDGQADNKSLVIRGWHRAGSWAVLFGGSYRDFPAPGAIYAASPVSGAGEEVSQRPLQTVRPLAERLHLTPITHSGHGDENRVAADVTKRTASSWSVGSTNSSQVLFFPPSLGRRSFLVSHRNGMGTDSTSY
jgi:hypothetical protein